MGALASAADRRRPQSSTRAERKCRSRRPPGELHRLPGARGEVSGTSARVRRNCRAEWAPRPADAVRLVGRISRHRGLEAVGSRRARAVRRRPADRVRRAQERDRHDRPRRPRLDSRVGSLVARPPPKTDPGDRVRRRNDARAGLTDAGGGAAGARAPRLLRCAPLHRRRRAGGAGVLHAPGRRCADTAVDRRARLPDVDHPQRLCGSSAHSFEPGSRTGALLQALLQCARPARAACAGDLGPRRLRTRRHSAIGPLRPGTGVPLRALPRGRLSEAGGGCGASPLRREAGDGIQRRLRSGCVRGGRNLRARGVGLDRRAAACSGHDRRTVRHLFGSSRRPTRRQRDLRDHPDHGSGRERSRGAIGVGSRHESDGSRRHRLVRLRGPPGRAAVDVGTRETSLAAELRSSPSRRGEPRSRGLSCARTG